MSIDSGDHDAVEDVTPDQLEILAGQPASKAFVINTCAKCWVKKWVSGVRIKWAFAIGVLVAIQAVGVFAVRAVTEQTVRETVLRVLRENRLIASDEPQIYDGQPWSVVSHAHAETKGPTP
jgi:hypothetical protein